MSTKKLTNEEVLHIANLCNLTLSADELERLGEMLTDTIDYIKVLEELDTDSTNETYQVTGKTNVFQKPDEPETTLTQEESLANAAEKINDLFATKAVFDR